MKAEFTSFPKKSNFAEGTVNDYTFSAKLFDEPSHMGIDDGRVSKFDLINSEGNIVVHYDRDWDLEPSENCMEEFKAVMELLENAPRRFDHVKKPEVDWDAYNKALEFTDNILKEAWADHPEDFTKDEIQHLEKRGIIERGL